MPKMKTKRGPRSASDCPPPAGSREAGPTSGHILDQQDDQAEAHLTWRHSSASRTRAGCARMLPYGRLKEKTKVRESREEPRDAPTQEDVKLARGTTPARASFLYAPPRGDRESLGYGLPRPPGAQARVPQPVDRAHQRRGRRTACPYSRLMSA